MLRAAHRFLRLPYVSLFTVTALEKKVLSLHKSHCLHCSSPTEVDGK